MYLSGVSNALATVKVKIFLYLLACLYCRVYCYQNTEENKLGRIFFRTPLITRYLDEWTSLISTSDVGRARSLSIKGKRIL